MLDKELKALARKYMNEHKKAWRDWNNGDIKGVWEDEYGKVCIKYNSGKWWHYKVEDNGDVVWW